MSFSGLVIISNVLPTVCGSYSNIVDETKATRYVLPTVMARWPNSDEGMLGRENQRQVIL